jgi:hypothetical protein
MTAPVIPCDSCGSPIPDSDLETGNAISLLGKRYCAGCKTEAVQSVSLDDLAANPAAPRPAAPKPAARPAPKPPAKALPPVPAPGPARAERAERKAAPRRPAPAAKTSSRAPILIAAAAAVAIVGIVAGVVVFRSGSTPPSETSGPVKPGSSQGSNPNRPAPDRETQAEEVSLRAGVSWDLVIAAAVKAKPDCLGTPWEKRLEELRSRAAHEKETEDAARDLTPLVDELKGAVATDPDFKRYAELQPKFQLALEMAGKTSPAKMPEIRALREGYNRKYEKLAEPHYDRIHEAATSLAEERRFDDALRQIDSFPQNLRQSGAWMTLEKLRQDIERRKKSQPKK